MPFTEDKSVFFNTSEFAFAGSYTPCGYPHTSEVTSTVNGIFDHRYFEAEGIQGEKPVFLIDEGDIAQLSQGDMLTVNSTIYKIVDWEKSGNGLMILVLHENDT